MIQHLLNMTRRLMGVPQAEERILSLVRQRSETLLYEQRRLAMTEHIMNDVTLGVDNCKHESGELIVSLTSYGRRLLNVPFVIESIMQQTVKPNRIILWLAHDDYKRIPLSLRRQQERGLEIEECDDIMSYKKIIPTLRRYPDATIITIDDDAIYDYDLVEHLLSAHAAAPNCIHACRVHRMTFDDRGILRPYVQWEWSTPEAGADVRNFSTGIGGVLYPAGSLDDEVLNEAVFMDICRTADDVWLKAMALKKGTSVNKVQTRNLRGEDYVMDESVQDTALFNRNFVHQSLNDIQLQAVLSRYNLFDRLRP